VALGRGARQIVILGAVACVLAGASSFLVAESSDPAPDSVERGDALQEYAGDITQGGVALRNAPTDVGLGLFTNTTRAPITITGITLVGPGDGFRLYRRWTISYCGRNKFVEQTDGDPRLYVDTYLRDFNPYPFVSIEVPPVGASANVPTSLGGSCGFRGASPLYYMFEVIPTLAGTRTEDGFDIDYTWEGHRLVQYEPERIQIDIRKHKYWHGLPTIAQLWGRGLPPS
jgi:hypothetical protein